MSGKFTSFDKITNESVEVYSISAAKIIAIHTRIKKEAVYAIYFNDVLMFL